MDRSEVINLISVAYVKDKYGVNRKVETSRQVYCNVGSVTQSEFFQCAQAGLKPEYRFSMFLYDYGGETLVEYKGTKYSVYRTYKGATDIMELYVQKAAGDGGNNISG